MKASVSSYSFNQYLKTGKLTQIECVKKAKEMGFDGIEFTPLMPCENPTLEDQLKYAAEIKAEAEKCGIEIVSYTIRANLYYATEEECEAEVERLKRQVDVAAALGVKVMRHDVCYSLVHNGISLSFDKMLPTIAKNARAVAEYARTLGIKTCTENHGFIAQDSDRVERLYNAVNSDNYGILIDVGNFACADEDSVLAVSRVAPYAFHVHVKDFKKYPYGSPEYSRDGGIVTRACNKIVAASVGYGDIPVLQCLAILKNAGYDGFVSIEYEGAENCIEGIAKSKANLDKYIAILENK